MSNALFTYGTLQIPEVMEAVAGMELSWIAAEAPGFAQFRFMERIYPGMVSRKGAMTQGRIYTSIHPQTWEILDRFEDPIYQRDLIKVHRFDGMNMMAHAYVLPLEQEHLLSSEIWRMKWFVENHLEGYVSRCRLFHKAMTSNDFSETFFTRPL
jgi:gamma-glutamylcyclotransferase (GGCT)/AIG2-like uncharacterized protein YtfP